MFYLYLAVCAFFTVVYVAAEWEKLSELIKEYDNGKSLYGSQEEVDVFKLWAACLLIGFPFTGTYVILMLLGELLVNRAGNLIISLCEKVLKVSKR